MGLKARINRLEEHVSDCTICDGRPVVVRWSYVQSGESLPTFPEEGADPCCVCGREITWVHLGDEFPGSINDQHSDFISGPYELVKRLKVVKQASAESRHAWEKGSRPLHVPSRAHIHEARPNMNGHTRKAGTA